jgi:DNA-binding NarL/FixJ family response regulator
MPGVCERETDSVGRVLIADDHPLVRDGLRTVIDAAFDGCVMFDASSVADAIEVIEREGDFDLVLLDLNMPGTPGLSGLVALRNRFPSVPVVIVSATYDPELVRSAIASGAAGFIPKSLKRGAIVEALTTIHAGNLYVGGDIEGPPIKDGPAAYREIGDVVRRLKKLTSQQRRVLELIVQGKLNKQIAHDLDITERTVKAHVGAILTKLHVFSRTQAVIAAKYVSFPSEDHPMRCMPSPKFKLGDSAAL